MMPSWRFWTAASLAVLISAPAFAGGSKWEERQARESCVQLAKVKHPDLQGKALVVEVRKCRADPSAYNGGT